LFNTTNLPCFTSQEDKEECDRVVVDRWFATAGNGEINDIKRLLKRGFKVNFKINIKGIDGCMTALMCAAGAAGGHMEIVTLFLENKADVDKWTGNGHTALYAVTERWATLRLLSVWWR
jgi:hypothetical protein